MYIRVLTSETTVLTADLVCTWSFCFELDSNRRCQTDPFWQMVRNYKQQDSTIISTIIIKQDKDSWFVLLTSFMLKNLFLLVQKKMMKRN